MESVCEMKDKEVRDTSRVKETKLENKIKIEITKCSLYAQREREAKF